MVTRDVIRTQREKLGMSQQQLADAVGVSRGAVQHWERGTTAPKRNLQNAVARKLQITVAQLMQGLSDIDGDANEDRAPAATPAPSAYDPLIHEALELLSSLEPALRKEAVRYLRYLAGGEPSFRPKTKRGRDSVPPPAKAA